uniref:Uncharacterized protein n=1 Tax=Heterorhabditis bacteriophora TaxID=37862 RepID=A0A1I7WFU9_HETBA
MLFNFYPTYQCYRQIGPPIFVALFFQLPTSLPMQPRCILGVICCAVCCLFFTRFYLL